MFWFVACFFSSYPSICNHQKVSFCSAMWQQEEVLLCDASVETGREKTVSADLKLSPSWTGHRDLRSVCGLFIQQICCWARPLTPWEVLVLTDIFSRFFHPESPCPGCFLNWCGNIQKQMDKQPLESICISISWVGLGILICIKSSCGTDLAKHFSTLGSKCVL